MEVYRCHYRNRRPAVAGARERDKSIFIAFHAPSASRQGPPFPQDRYCE
jgi:hypothetical protein